MNIIKSITDIISSAFFLTTGTVAVITYISAKKTILQPIKTQVFKKQVEAFSEIMELFNGKSEFELRNLFGFDKIIKANAIKLLDEYAELFFDVKINRENRPYNNSDCPIIVISKEYAEKYLELADDPITKKQSEDSEKENKADPMTRAIIWKNYKYGIVSIPKENVEAMKKIELIIKSPFLTQKSVEHLMKIKEIVNKNTYKMIDILTNISQELPERYPNFDKMKVASISWIENRYNSEFISLDDCCDQLTDYLRSYLKSDSIMD
jgi:hypothetical protein